MSSRAELAAEIDQLRRRAATWEIAALTLMLVSGLDDETAARLRARVRELTFGTPS